MIDKIKKKVLAMLDLEHDKVDKGLYIVLPIIGMLIARCMGQKGAIAFMIGIVVLLAVATIIQLVRKNRNIKNFLTYLGATIFGIFMIAVIWLIRYYGDMGDGRMAFNIVKVFLIVFSMLMDVLLIPILKNKRTPKSKKIISTISAIVITIIALLGIVFLPPKDLPLK
ncbi:hypothetical protein [Clostridium cellulovorans]|uniref:Uncharacterized protein n=1 Tax=Clostridium cellulovorans (strain ATCC 35296 / DSM 3052 / OCM 3 / 743B) TaxID=573061 RepID=D9SP72_CLOC7|nr:hypothetical protein [Clostridium cellulovorans]ADL52037.1 hypothetical protein Clocel_2315 [Clostridium cellulovorans 743B]